MRSTSTRRALRPVGVALTLIIVIAALAPRLQPVAAATPQASTRAMAAPFDRQFIDMMAPHHQSAVAMAQVALTRAQHPQIKSLARSIITDQNSEISQMKAWRAQWYGSSTTPSMANMPMLPGLKTGMSGMSMMQDIATLKKANPFDKAFIDAMMPHHQLAIDAATLELAHGTHQQLKDLALSIIKGQSREEGLMQAYRDLWYGGMSGMSGRGRDAPTPMPAAPCLCRDRLWVGRIQSGMDGGSPPSHRYRSRNRRGRDHVHARSGLGYLEYEISRQGKERRS